MLESISARELAEWLIVMKLDAEDEKAAYENAGKNAEPAGDVEDAY